MAWERFWLVYHLPELELLGLGPLAQHRRLAWLPRLEVEDPPEQCDCQVDDQQDSLEVSWVGSPEGGLHLVVCQRGDELEVATVGQ